jgi:hypothetical protein
MERGGAALLIESLRGEGINGTKKSHRSEEKQGHSHTQFISIGFNPPKELCRKERCSLRSGINVDTIDRRKHSLDFAPKAMKRTGGP